MKIIRNGVAYVQKYDILKVSLTDKVPPSIIYTQFGKGIVRTDENSKFEFVEFNNNEEVEFFRRADWIIDYDEVKELSNLELLNKCDIVTKKMELLKEQYKKYDDNEKILNKDVIYKSKLLEHKIESLQNFILFKDGSLKMPIPVQLESEKFQKKKTI